MSKKVVQKKGQKFKYNGQEFTADYFFGPDAEPFETLKEAQKKHPSRMICVCNKETGGCSDVNFSFLIKISSHASN